MKKNLFRALYEQIEPHTFANAVTKDSKVTFNAPLGVLPFLMDAISRGRHAVYIASDELEAEDMFETLKTAGHKVFFFPEVDVIPFSNVFPSQDKLSDRVQTLYHLFRSNHPFLIVTTLEALVRKLPPADWFDLSILELAPGKQLDSSKIAEKLVQMAYFREVKVSQPGGFSIRGDIIDVFPPHTQDAIRINIFGDEVESIKLFNPITQVSIREIDSCEIIPASEFSMEREKKSSFQVKESSVHSYFPEFYTKTVSLSEYSRLPVVFLYSKQILTEEEKIQAKYHVNLPDKLKNVGKSYLITPFQQIPRQAAAECVGLIETSDFSLPFRPPPEFGNGFSSFVREIGENYLENAYHVFLFVEYKDLASRLSKILRKFKPQVIDQDVLPHPDTRLAIIIAPLEKGFEVPDQKLLILSESDISGKKRLFRKRIRQIDSFFEDIDEIKDGEAIVHLNYGIGIFRGIQRINTLGTAKDFILIEYADHEKLYVPLEQADLIGKYIGVTQATPRLDALGSKSWSKKREKVKKSIEDYAGKLVSIYARRSSLKGHAFGEDTEWQRTFEDRFPYIETPDQIQVVEEIKNDMERPVPMDRLLCGDVGFGKTEVAMRAAFKAVIDGKQVALIAPTTVLVEQHYLSFIERFRGFPVRIESVSRFTSARKLTQIVNKIQNHELDILIGTHKLFSDRLKFHSLGLVIIDEEHKFGVEHKEKMKEKYPVVDFLALSATPIPRTLNMSLSSIRDISLLKTPPDMRIPVQTYVSEFNMEILKYAIEQELDRNGQVFFVHNTIKRLPEYAFAIEKMLPDAKVTIGHGQMNESMLDEAFIGFVKGEYNVFVCTTIIESGLDIPNANTIIISDAHRLGLSQLHQLKGRVGRAKKEGHAYFLYPAEKALSENAQKRLYVINEYTDLGAGFNIAMKDMEIRGSGNLLGKEQHGNIISVGYDVYMHLLRDEVEKLKGNFKETIETKIDLKYNAYLPDDFITDASIKMEIYKKILSVKDEKEIRELSHELLDRFGMIPDEVYTLFEISRLKIRAGDMGIETLIEKGKYIEIGFSRFSRVDPMKVIALLQTSKHEIDIKPHEKNKIYYHSFEASIDIKVKRLLSFLEDIRDKK